VKRGCRHQEHLLETYDGRVTLSVEALKTLMLINGGTVITVLAADARAEDAA
jgi:hypothetical protein